jgi:hypothetical protein
MSEFTDAVYETLRGEYESGFILTTGIATKVCEQCSDWYEEEVDEGSFSWTRCESCGSSLGGQRYVAHLIAHEPEEGWPGGEKGPDVYHISICADCLIFHANGDEPDPNEWRAK